MTQGIETWRPNDVVRLERDRAVAKLIINRPEHENAINMDVRDGISRALDQIREDTRLRCLVIEGAGDEDFSIGADIEQISTMLPDEAAQMAQRALEMHQRIEELQIPVIAAIKGSCIGMGLELALHCDIRLARADARLGLPGINIGLVSGGGTLDLLGRTIGEGPARALALTGGIITAQRAFMIGLVTNVVPIDEFDEALKRLTAHFSYLPPISTAETKRLLGLAKTGNNENIRQEGVASIRRCFVDGEIHQRLGRASPDARSDATVH